MFVLPSGATLRMAVHQGVQETASVFHVPTYVEEQSGCQAEAGHCVHLGGALLTDDRRGPAVTCVCMW